jgi:CHAT domain-containing protein
VLLLALAATAATPPTSAFRTSLAEAQALFERRAYDEALAVLRPLVRDAEAARDPALLARALFYTARSHYFLSDYRAALPFFERALEASRTAKDRSFEAEVQRGIARLHKQQGTYSEGLRSADLSIAIYDELGLRREAARTWLTVGALRDLMGEFDRALAAYERARIGLADLKDHEYYTLFNEIGITYTNLGRYEDALASHLVSLEGRQKIGDKYFIGISHANIGDVYFSLGQFERAIEHYEKCVQICGEAGERRSIAVALGQMAQAWLELRDPRRALEYARREHAVTRELGTEHLEAVALRHLGEAERLLGDLDASSRHHEQALELARKAGALADETATLIALAEIELTRRRAEPARGLAERALQLAQRTHAPDLEVEARYALARSARLSDDGAKALQHLAASVAVIDSVRGRVRTDSGKIGYLDTRQGVYHELADTLQEQGRIAQGLEVAEAARGRAFSDLLAAQQLALAPDARESLAAIREAERQLRAEEAATSTDDTMVAQLVRRRAAAATQLEGKWRALRSAQPELASLVAADPPRVAEISATAARLDATLVEYLVTEKRLLIWTIRPTGEIRSTAVNVGRDALRGKIRALHARLNGLTADELRRPQAVRRELAELDRWLLAPVAGELPRDPAALVYVIPHDALLLVPFGALVDASGRYAAQRHTLASAPSSAVLRYTALKKQQVVSAERPYLLALADPTPPKDAAHDALPGARAEVQQLMRRFPRERSLALVGTQATEAATKRLAAGQTIVHFAVHGLIRDDRPWESALLLAPGEGEDGWLKVPEIFGLELRADLVALSGCSTGLGRLSGDGIVGMARALIYAGTPSVIVSQWDVSDASTAYLMERFYAELTAGRTKAHALRAAQLATQKRYPHPALWAAFLLVGEPQ